jgi:hypothetical protein
MDLAGKEYADELRVCGQRFFSKTACTRLWKSCAATVNSAHAITKVSASAGRRPVSRIRFATARPQ